MAEPETAEVAEAFPVGEYLRDEIDARGWGIGEFAQIIGRPVQAVSEILNGKKEITLETASEIAAATGTEASTWLNLQTRFTLWNTRLTARAKLRDIERRAALASLVPLGELRKRGLIVSGDLDTEELQVWTALGIRSAAERPCFALAARRTATTDALSSAQLAWLAFARIKARESAPRKLDRVGLASLGENLTRSITTVESIVDLPRRYAEVGVRLVYLAPFKSGKIDGAAFADESGPVIAVSGRGNALDKFLFTLVHETAHVLLGHADHGVAIDDDIAAVPMNDQERAADALASQWVLRRPVTLRAGVSSKQVQTYAEQEGVHPAVIVGRLHHEKVIPWSHLNGLVPKIEESLAQW